jgi:hypothetical protein
MTNWCKSCETPPIKTNYKLNKIIEWIIDRKQLYMNVKSQEKTCKTWMHMIW